MKKDIMRVFSVNLIKMLSTLLTTFFVPAILSIENYGHYKMYLFYVSYIGASHLGFCDGIYLKYGGMKKEEVNERGVSIEHKTLFIFEIIVSFAVLILGAIRRDFCIFILALTNIPLIFIGFYNFIFQAVGDFRRYSRNQLMATIINLLLTIGLLVFKIDDYKIYVLLHCIIQYISWYIAFVFFRKDYRLLKVKASVKVLFSNISIGFLLLAGNFVYNFFLGIDKWFIKFTMNIEDFSMYSFAGQLLSVVNMFVTPIGLTLYSNISKRKNKKFERKTNRILFALLLLTPLFVYVLEIIIRMFLKKYIGALDVIAILFVAHIFISINTIFYVNLYKAYKLQKQYFIRMIVALIVALFLNSLVLITSATIEGYAIATFGSAIIWFWLNCCYFQYLKPDLKCLFFVISLIAVFGGTVDIDSIIIKILIYVISYIVLLRYMLNDVWEYITNQIKLQIANIYSFF